MSESSMFTRLLLCATVLALACAGGPSEVPATTGSDLGELLPSPSALDGWTVAEGPVELSPEGLWEYLNGGAPLYLGYGFRRLVHVRYQLGDDELASITLDVFDMGSELGAFGIYSSGRPPGVEFKQWGAEGYRSGYMAAAWKGSHFVQAEADDDRTVLIEKLESLVAGVCDEIAGDPAFPEILGWLPTEGLVAHSERFVAEDLLGHSFLPGGVLAEYEIDGRKVQLFFSDLETAEAADEAIAELRDHRSKWGEILGDPPSVGAGGFRFSHSGLGSGTVVRFNGIVAGAQGDFSFEEHEDLLTRLESGLSSPPG
jgi:hypothetical protein